MGAGLIRTGLLLAVAWLGACRGGADRRVESLFEARQLGGMRQLAAATQALDDPAPQVRAVAVWMLAQTYDPSVEPLIAGKLADPSAAVRAAALAGLEGLAASPDRLPEVLPLTRDVDPIVRARALRLVRLWGAYGSPELALASLDDPDGDVRLESILALGDIQQAHALAALADHLVSDPDWRVREAAASVLAERTEDEARALLQIAGADVHPLVRAAAQHAAARFEAALQRRQLAAEVEASAKGNTGGGEASAGSSPPERAEEASSPPQAFPAPAGDATVESGTSDLDGSLILAPGPLP